MKSIQCKSWQVRVIYLTCREPQPDMRVTNLQRSSFGKAKHYLERGTNDSVLLLYISLKWKERVTLRFLTLITLDTFQVVAAWKEQSSHYRLPLELKDCRLFGVVSASHLIIFRRQHLFCIFVHECVNFVILVLCLPGQIWTWTFKVSCLYTMQWLFRKWYLFFWTELCSVINVLFSNGKINNVWWKVKTNQV